MDNSFKTAEQTNPVTIKKQKKIILNDFKKYLKNPSEQAQYLKWLSEGDKQNVYLNKQNLM